MNSKPPKNTYPYPRPSPQDKKKYLEALCEIARSRGGKCLSDAYVNKNTKLTFQCHKGHIWQTTPAIIKYEKSWCPICRREKTRRTLEDLHNLAAQRGGKCLATEYPLMITKTKWQCAKGHIWEAAASDIQAGKWCKQCALDKRLLTIEQMQEIARSRGGKCLSTHYTLSKEKLLWECKLGHTWYATPHCIKLGTWCPSCAHLSRCKHDKAKRKYLPQTQKK